VRELLARVRALLRRAAPRQAPDELTLGDVRFDFRALTAAGGGAADLTTHDILVMKVLAAHRGELVRRIDIVEEVCGLDSDATLRTVDNHVMALRRAVGDDPRRPRFLHTVRGEGYRLTME
jgi:DNA-binding response OmpR family regulator